MDRLELRVVFHAKYTGDTADTKIRKKVAVGSEERGVRGQVGCALREVRLQYGRHGRVCHAVFHAMYDRWHCDHHEDPKKWSADEGGSILVKEFCWRGLKIRSTFAVSRFMLLTL